MEDIIALIEADLGQPQKKTGRWWFWHCPFHADPHPSLGVTLENGSWFCFQCGVGGDARTWLWKYRSVKTSSKNSRLYRTFLKKEEKILTPPEDIWQARAQLCIEKWMANLWDKPGKAAQRYLNERGLKNETLQKYQIGYNPVSYHEPMEQWGLKAQSKDDQPLFIPAGISIPWAMSGVIWKVNVRRFNSTSKYLQLRGSQPGIFGADTIYDHPITYIVEGEFDAMLLEHVAGDLIGVCTLGSASSRHLSSKWLSYFLQCQRIYLVGDNDLAGREWAEALMSASQRLKNIQVPEGKDITDFWRMGGDLSAWTKKVANLEIK